MAAAANSNLVSAIPVIFKMKKFFATLVGGTLVTAALNASAAFNPGNLPLWFEAATDATAFTTRSPGAEFAITANGAEITLQKSASQSATVRMSFVGGNTATQLRGEQLLTGKVNRIIGNDAAQWSTGLSAFAQVQLENIYPGVSVTYYGNAKQLEYDFNLAVGVNPEIIALRFDGADKISVDADGQLILQVNGGQLFQHPPVAFQIINGTRRPVAASYKMNRSEKTVGFTIGTYDHSQPLVIDPTFATYFGGSVGETTWAVAVNPTDDSIYVAGQTYSAKMTNNVPFSTVGSFATNYQGGALTGDAFVAKFDSTGQNLFYCTYLGGTGNDVAFGLAVDTDGHAYVAGATTSKNFPVKNAVTNGAYNGSLIGGPINPATSSYHTDAFVTELSADGTGLVYSTYLGGGYTDFATGVAVDESGNAFVTGCSYSTNFPITGAAYQKQFGPRFSPFYRANAFVVEIPAGAQHLNYSTYLGGTNFDIGNAIAYNNGNVFITGSTTSTNFPWFKGLSDSRLLNGRTNFNGFSDAFVAMFAKNGTNLDLQYSTFLGSTNQDVATAIAADADASAYIAGWTTSTNFPNTTTGVQLSSYVRTNKTGFAVATNAFFTKLAWDGSTLTRPYSQMFGGRGLDAANGIALDSSKNVYVVGSVTSTNFPVTTNEIIAINNSIGSTNFLSITNRGQGDIFLTVFPADLLGQTNLLLSTYIGGKQKDSAYGITIDSANNLVIAGSTASTNFPTLNALYPKRNGTNDTFLLKLALP
jgi:hypothetical protein